MKVKRSVINFAIGGSVGWVVENIYSRADGEPERYSKLLGSTDYRIPFLPSYAFGAVILGKIVPMLADVPLIVRAMTYGGALSLYEFTICQMDRFLGHQQWNYNPNDTETAGCVDFRHTIAWTALALLTEPLWENGG